MEKDVHQLLKESGYLSSPANRFFWKNATPSLRTHLRQYLIASSSAALPLAALIAWLSRLSGVDAFILFGFYLITFLAGAAALDLAMGLMARLPFMERFWNENKLLNMLPAPLAALALLLIGQSLFVAVRSHTAHVQLLIWAGLALCAWIIGSALHLMLLSRLYWHGIRPPQLHRHPLMTLVVMVIVVALQLLRSDSFQPLSRIEVEHSPTLILALDVPRQSTDRYAAMLPPWPTQHLDVADEDITNMWTELATGTPAVRHQASLVAFSTPLFRGNLNRHDPTQQLPLLVLHGLGLTKPVTEGGRFRKYFWEIMDDFGLRTWSMGYWHTFPASSQNGGVLSDRWRADEPRDSQAPTRVGMRQLEPVTPLRLNTDAALLGPLDRENQVWAQLHYRANRADFDLCIAYLPLADLLRDSSDPQAEQESLRMFRAEQLERLFESLPQETRVVVLLSSGIPHDDGRPIRLRIISNWLHEVAQPFTGHMELAPTLLEDYGIPADRMMVDSRNHNSSALDRVDYGEPENNRQPNPESDKNYYEELKSLGYVK